MHVYQVPIERPLDEADPDESDSYRQNALHCLTMIERWEVMEKIKSERAKYLAGGIAMGAAFFFLLWVVLL